MENDEIRQLSHIAESVDATAENSECLLLSNERHSQSNHRRQIRHIRTRKASGHQGHLGCRGQSLWNSSGLRARSTSTPGSEFVNDRNSAAGATVTLGLAHWRL